MCKEALVEQKRQHPAFYEPASCSACSVSTGCAMQKTTTWSAMSLQTHRGSSQVLFGGAHEHTAFFQFPQYNMLS